MGFKRTFEKRIVFLNITITSGSGDAWPYFLGVIKSSNTEEKYRRKVKGRRVQ